MNRFIVKFKVIFVSLNQLLKSKTHSAVFNPHSPTRSKHHEHILR